MKKRTITALLSLCVLIPVLIFSDTLVFPLALAICSIIAIFEIVNCVGLKHAYLVTWPLFVIGGATPFAVRYLKDFSEIRRLAWIAAIFCILYFLSILTFRSNKYKLSDVSTCFMSVLYIIIGFNSILILYDYQNGGEYVYLATFICAWVTDIFAYICGRLFGKHKLLPEVSPKKTVEGSIGGIVFCILAILLYGVIINDITDGLHANYLVLLIAGFLTSIIAQIGDLSMSVIKRTYGIKDYGKIFPGHGGMLDRFDSVLAVSTVLLVICSFFRMFEVV